MCSWTYSGNVRRSLESKSVEQTLLEALDVLVLLEVLRGHAEASAHHHHHQDAPTMHHCGIVGGTPALRARRQAGERAQRPLANERMRRPTPPHRFIGWRRRAANRCPPPPPPPQPPLPARSGPRSRWPPASRKRPHPPTALSPIHPLRPGTRLETMRAPDLICSANIFSTPFY